MVKGKKVKHRTLLFGCFLSSFFFTGDGAFGALPEKPYINAIKASAKNDYAKAFDVAKKTADPLLLKLIEWFELTDTKQNVDFKKAERFMKKNPNWPRIYLIRRNAEQSLIQNGSDKEKKEWFKQYQPVSAQAVLSHATLLMKEKKWEKAIPMLHALWDYGNLTEKEADTVKEQLSFLLDERDFRLRAKKLLDERKVFQAKQYFPLINKEDRQLLETRAALIKNTSAAKKKLRELPVEYRKDTSLILDEIRWLRTNKKYSIAAKLLEKISPEKSSNRRWTEKYFLIRQFLTDGDFENAYALAKNHTLKKGRDFADAEWTAGWIALRHLKKKKAAVEHFKKMLQSVSSPLSVARGEYWLARAYEEMNDTVRATSYYEKAAEKQTTLYGQLAEIKLNKPSTVSSGMPIKKPDQALVEKLKKSELFKITQMLENSEQHETAALFATRMYLDASSAEEILALASLVSSDLKRDDLAVIFSRRARQNGIDIGHFAYPVWDLNHDEQTEKALVLSIIRQESSFSSHAISSAGARGLMQIMPATAKQMARKKRKSFSVQKLNLNPDFNVELGSTYFAELLKRFDGSYILAIAAYNAGPSNVKKWLKTIGHPLKNTDPIDWIERIPFNETRNYVQRVLENLYVYRRLLNPSNVNLFDWIQKKD